MNSFNVTEQQPISSFQELLNKFYSPNETDPDILMEKEYQLPRGTICLVSIAAFGYMLMALVALMVAFFFTTNNEDEKGELTIAPAVITTVKSALKGKLSAKFYPKRISKKKTYRTSYKFRNRKYYIQLEKEKKSKIFRPTKLPEKATPLDMDLPLACICNA